MKDKQLNVRIDPRIWEEFHQYAVNNGFSKKEMLEEALKRFLASKPQKLWE